MSAEARQSMRVSQVEWKDNNGVRVGGRDSDSGRRRASGRAPTPTGKNATCSLYSQPEYTAEPFICKGLHLQFIRTRKAKYLAHEKGITTSHHCQ